MAVTGRQKSYVFFALNVAIIASAIAMFVSASSRAFWESVVSCDSARSSATRFHMAIGVSDCQKRAVSVSQAVRTVLVALPYACTSARSCAHRALVSGGGPAGKNCDGAVSAHGVIVAYWRKSGAPDGGVGS